MDVRDLIGKPYSEANCSAIAREALTRLGCSCPWLDEWSGWRGDRGAEEVEEAIDAVIERAAGRWRRVPAATELGDLIVSDSTPGSVHALHLGVLVELPDRVLTSFPRTGAVLVRLRTVARIRGVWRWA